MSAQDGMATAELPSLGAATRVGRITVIDDNDEFVALIRDVFADRLVVTSLVPDGATAAVASTRPDLLIVDLHAGWSRDEPSGWSMVMRARELDELREVPILLCSGDHARLMAEEDRVAGERNVHVLAKPFDLATLESTVASLLDGAG